MTEIDPKTPETKKESWSELMKTALIALLLAVLIRSFAWEPFNIPSGSMFPTLMIGDYLFVDKYPYGYSRYSFPFGVMPIEDRIWTRHMPKRGDVIVFKLPTNTSTDYIKRIIGMPGDKIQVINGRLYINNNMIERTPLGYERLDNGNGAMLTVMRYRETLPEGVTHDIYEESDTGPLDNAGPFYVPEGHYFGMGDNRDNSRDSRVMDLVGYIPFKNIVGRASLIFFSVSGDAPFYKVWEWPFDIRYSRLMQAIGPENQGSVIAATVPSAYAQDQKP